MSGIRVFAVTVTAGQTAVLAVCMWQIQGIPMLSEGGEGLAILTLGGSALAPAFVYVRRGASRRAGASLVGVLAAGAGWFLLCVNRMGTVEHGVGAILYMLGVAMYSLAMLGTEARSTEGYMVWFGMGLFFGAVSLSGQLGGVLGLAGWFEWACAMSHSTGMCAFYARHHFEEPLADAAAAPRRLRLDAPLLAGDESWE